MDETNWIPPDIPLDMPSAARIYDYLLGGYHNFERDRTIAENLIALCPDMRPAAQANRAFLRRAVQFLLNEGIDQFLDIGSGIPTVGNVHEVAQALNPATRVVYVDIDPVAVSHSNSMLQRNPNAIAIRGDIREPERILDFPELKKRIDFQQPVGLLLVAILHYVVVDDVAYRAVGTLRRALAPGSYVAIAHASRPAQLTEPESELHKTFRPAGETKNRSPEQIGRFFEGLDLVEPGLVYSPLWRPEGPDDVLLQEPARSMVLAGVGHKL